MFMHLLKRREAIQLADCTYVIINATKEIKPWWFYVYAFIETV
mgnify:CR=1 FL=1|jgi:hypothetical protein